MSKILLVEDNPDAVKRIIRYINKIFAELDVISFPEAGDALQYAKANDISLFIQHWINNRFFQAYALCGFNEVP